jgi:hypothetical protein
MNDYSVQLFALDLLDRADEFFSAFRDLPNRGPPSWPRYFLFCHSVELALKAYIVWHSGLTDTEVKNRFGHDLKKLLTEAVRLGLSLTPSARSGLELLDEAHRKFWPRYPRAEGGLPVFVIDSFEPHAVELIDAVSITLRPKRP